MATTHIFNQHNTFISEGKNLRIINDKAREYKGVTKITLYRITDSKFYESLVFVYFKNGFHAVTNFADHSVALKWARAKRTRNGTYWTGCEVSDNNY